MIIAGTKIYDRCPACRKLVRLNKPITGDLHVCVSAEDRVRQSKAMRAIAVQRDFIERAAEKKGRK